MEKHKCKLCFRSFSNGRALGGHMRSHMMNLPIPPKEDNKLAEEPTESASSQSLSLQQQQQQQQDYEEEDDDIDKSLYYGLRENPKRSIKLVDPEFSMILQDRESETESSKNPTRRRSKRARKPDPVFTYHHDHHHHHQYQDKVESCWAEPEPVSSISDATTEEDVAFCLMMMSRDNWKKKKSGKEYDDEEDDFEEEEEEEEEEESEFEEEEEQQQQQQQQQQTSKCPKSNSGGRNNKYKCETCDKVFRSYQALGGHRASHKKVKLAHVVSSELNDTEFKIRSSNGRDNAAVIGAPPAEKKVHKCPVCFRVFASGQALGGHKRSHVIGSAHETTAAKTTTTIVSPVVVVVDRRLNNKIGESLIDLNLPAPDYDDWYDDNDEISQIELSAVSDAEFVNNTIIRQ